MGQIIRAFKSVSARAVNRLLGRPEGALWQRNYFDRVIRDTAELGKIREYISTNPLRWGSDRENPEVVEEGSDRW